MGGRFGQTSQQRKHTPSRRFALFKRRFLSTHVALVFVLDDGAAAPDQEAKGLILLKTRLAEPTKAKVDAATNAIMVPLPVLSSAERYRPTNKQLSPITCVQIKHPRKLRLTNWAVAAGSQGVR